MATIVNKTALMLRVQDENGGEQIETLVPRLIEEKGGVTQAAETLGISKDTLGIWLLKMQYTVRIKVVPIGSAPTNGTE